MNTSATQNKHISGLPFGVHVDSHHSDDIIAASSLQPRILERRKDEPALKSMESKYMRYHTPKTKHKTPSWKLIASRPYGPD